MTEENGEVGGKGRTGKKWMSHRTFLAALVVMAAVAMFVIWGNVL